jgi:hypothetical protein
MKKLILIAFFAIFAASLKGQIVSTMVKSAVTLTNAATVTATLQTQSVCENVSIQAVVTKSTGTVAGTVTVQGSLDGVNYVSIPTATFALTDVATQNKVFEFTNNEYMFWRVAFVGTGTQVVTPNAYLFISGSTNKHAINNMLSPFSAVSDTTDNSGTSFLTFGVQRWYDQIIIQSVVTRLSGTAAGTVTLQGSIDGTNYSTVSTSYANAASYAVTNAATNTYIFEVTGSPYRYYRLSYTGTGTMSCSHRGYLMPNKK